MKKNISKELVIETTLNMIRDKNDLKSLNLREIARALGCAHTNLYNYFSSYSDLLWETYIALLNMSVDSLIEQVTTCNNTQSRLHCFFQRFADIYLDNQGWFRLAWLEYISDDRPENVTCTIEKTNQVLTQTLYEIWGEYTGKHLEIEQINQVLHDTHCYIIGEVSNYILGRGRIDNKAELKKYITDKAVLIFTLCLEKE